MGTGPRRRPGAPTGAGSGSPPEPGPGPGPSRPTGPASGRRPRRRSDLLARIAIAVPLIILAIGFVDVGGTAWAVLMILLGAACMNELFRLLNRWQPVPVIGYAALVAMCLAARYANHRVVLEVAMAAVPVLFLAIVARGQRGGTTVSIAGTLLGVYWIGFAFAHAVLLRQLHNGGGIIIDVMLGTFLGDTGAYLGGRLFGRRPLAPTISPNKTVEGLFCGMLVAILSVFIASLYQPWLTQGHALGLGVAIAVLGPIGDLFESLVKRDAGAKDTGHMFGAHGGALDRLDAVIFTIVAAYYIWVVLPHT